MDMSNLFMIHNGQLLPVVSSDGNAQLSSSQFMFHQNAQTTVTVGPDSLSKSLATNTGPEIMDGMGSSATSVPSTGAMGGKCQYCPKKFMNQNQLHNHMDDCRLSRPFDCSICGKRFKVKGGLQQHERIHINDRQYNCRFCPKNFIQKAHVDAHERRVHSIDTSLLETISPLGTSSTGQGRRGRRPRSDVSSKTETFTTISSKNGSTSSSNLNSSISLYMNDTNGGNIESNGPLNSHEEDEVEEYLNCILRANQCDFCDKRFRERKGVMYSYGLPY